MEMMGNFEVRRCENCPVKSKTCVSRFYSGSRDAERERSILRDKCVCDHGINE